MRKYILSLFALVILCQASSVSAVDTFNLKDANDLANVIKDNDSEYYLVAFWASWCGVCDKQMPQLSTLADKYKNHNIKILPISLDTNGERSVKKFYKSKKIKNLDIITDKEGSIFSKLNLRKIPSILLVSKNKGIMDYYLGLKNVNFQKIENLIGYKGAKYF